MKGIETQQCI